MENITDKEKALLTEIATSEYQDGGSVVDSKSKGGVLSSLQSKGLVVVNIVPMAKSENRAAGITDSTVAITEAGAAALKA